MVLEALLWVNEVEVFDFGQEMVIYGNELLVKLARGPFWVPSKVCHEIHFYIAVLHPKFLAAPSFHQNWGFSQHLDTPYIL